MARVRHALLRGLQGHYQLEEGEVLMESTPNRKDRRALLFYEAAEGGAGALSRLIEDPGEFRGIALRALEFVHYDPASFDAAIKDGAEALTETPDTRCVAGCYRCLRSYYNQPDHALIDRRQNSVKELLLRLANPDVRFLIQVYASTPMLAGLPASRRRPPRRRRPYPNLDLARRPRSRHRKRRSHRR